MTDQPDLKARVEEARRLQRFAEGESARTVYVIPPNGRFDDLRKDVSALLSRITDLEAERDKFKADCFAWETMPRLTVGGGLEVYGSMVAISRAQNYILLDSMHPVESEGVRRALARDLQAAESRLALAEKVVEAGRVARDALLLLKRGASDRQLIDIAKPMSAALTAYEENTSSNDLTTGEDDA